LQLPSCSRSKVPRITSFANGAGSNAAPFFCRIGESTAFLTLPLGGIADKRIGTNATHQLALFPEPIAVQNLGFSRITLDWVSWSNAQNTEAKK
jgi:hypothetical protein